jgi:hypothetical protein
VRQNLAPTTDLEPIGTLASDEKRASPPGKAMPGPNLNGDGVSVGRLTAIRGIKGEILVHERTAIAEK